MNFSVFQQVQVPRTQPRENEAKPLEIHSIHTEFGRVCHTGCVFGWGGSNLLEGMRSFPATITQTYMYTRTVLRNECHCNFHVFWFSSVPQTNNLHIFVHPRYKSHTCFVKLERKISGTMKISGSEPTNDLELRIVGCTVRVSNRMCTELGRVDMCGDVHTCVRMGV